MEEHFGFSNMLAGCNLKGRKYWSVTCFVVVQAFDMVSHEYLNKFEHKLPTNTHKMFESYLNSIQFKLIIKTGVSSIWSNIMNKSKYSSVDSCPFLDLNFPGAYVLKGPS